MQSAGCLDKEQMINFEEDDLVVYYTDLYEANFWKDGSVWATSSKPDSRQALSWRWFSGLANTTG